MSRETGLQMVQPLPDWWCSDPKIQFCLFT